MNLKTTKRVFGNAYKLVLSIMITGLILIFAFKGNAQNTVYNAAVSPTKMNVFYLGVDNPVSIAVTGAEKGKITAEIDNGTITGENGNYIVRLKDLGKAVVTVKVNGKEVSKQEFRVKKVPDPSPSISGKGNQSIFSKQELIDAGGISIVLTNFDFDLHFEVVGFSLSALDNGFVRTEPSDGNKFSKKQIEVINSTKSGGKIFIEDIKAKGPDGSIRMLGALAIKMQ